MHYQPKAVALVSGGLDSMLAAKIIQDQGVRVEGLNFFTGFCVEGHTHAIRSSAKTKRKRNNALWVAEQLGIRLHIIDVIEEYKEVVINPKHGYGANLNPCLDCKSFMVAKAKAWMDEHGFDFIVTGEVLGQRPKSQRRGTFPVIARESGANDRLLRPLSAKLQLPTLPEHRRWVDRSQLFGFNGRSRKPQIALARKYGFTDYSQPAGGCCFLTDVSYSGKLKDLWAHRGEKSYDFDDIMLLKIGRHLRLRPHMKLIVARDEGESRFMSGYRGRFTYIVTLSHLGPLALLQGYPDRDDLELAARLTARFSQGRNAQRVRLSVVTCGGEQHMFAVAPFPVADIPAEWYL